MGRYGTTTSCGDGPMMTAHKVAGSDIRGYSDYLCSHDTGDRGDYYLGRDGERQAMAGVWHGRGAQALGLTGDVEREAMAVAWDGRDPASGSQLVRRARGKEHVAAVDCTFSAPKSVSVVWALSDVEHRAAVEDAHAAAVGVALDHIEKHVALVRRRIDGVLANETVDGIVVSRFRHHTSRLAGNQRADGVAPDPQLHDHCAIANMALRQPGAGAANGRWGALDLHQIWRVAAEAGAVYRAELAWQLQGMGYRTHREGRYFEITGVPDDVRQSFSMRHREVQAAVARFAAEYGRQPTDLETKSLVVRSRASKAPDQGPAFDQWKTRGEDLGFGPKDVAALRAGTPREPAPFHRAARTVVRELTDVTSEKSLTKESAVVEARMLRIAVAEAAQGRVPGAAVGELIRVVERAPDVVAVGESGVTTRGMIAMEEAVLRRATELVRGGGGGGETTDPLGSAATEAAIAGARVPLIEEQAQAVRRLRAGGRFMMLTAPAGSGKGEVLRAVAQAHQADGRVATGKVVALAAAGETAQRLGDELGADEARTIDSFIFSAEKNGVVPEAGTLLVVDEAALLETSRWRKLLDHTGEATVIAAGDDRQLSSIEAGGIWGVMARRFGTVELAQNHRANEGWARDAWSALRRGAAPSAIRDFEQRGLIELHDTRAHARIVAVERWDRDRLAGAASGRGIEQYLLLTDSSNVEVDTLNGLAQARREVAGELGPEAVRVTDRDAKTGHEREEVLRPGDRVSFERRFTPAGLTGSAARRSRVENGAIGSVLTVDTVEKSVTVNLGKRTVVVDNAHLGTLRLGYAQHVYSAQGRTVDRAYVVQGGWQTDQERSYVGVSRAREQSVIVSDYSSLGVEDGKREEALGVLGERCATSKRKEAALSLLERVGGREVEMGGEGEICIRRRMELEAPSTELGYT